MLVHETTYKAEAGCAARIHMARLNRELEILNKLELPSVGRLADFGCSNGFLLHVMQDGVPAIRNWEYAGFDRNAELLKLAVQRQLDRATFHQLNLNSPRDVGRYDLVTCFETLEHVGNYEVAVRNLARACKGGGYLVISVPYEIGLPGVVKFLGRMVLRRNPYHDFFESRSKISYFLALLLRKRTNTYRIPEQEGWSVHLGFDNRVFDNFLRSELTLFTLLEKRTSFFGFNVIYVFRKAVD